jgi:hypothetical protein
MALVVGSDVPDLWPPRSLRLCGNVPRSPMQAAWHQERLVRAPAVATQDGRRGGENRSGCENFRPFSGIVERTRLRYSA